MKIIVYSHPYMASENKKNIISLATHCDIRCILPTQLPGLVNRKFLSKDILGNSELFYPHKALIVFRSQYILVSLSLGFRNFKPDIINIEYNPWSLMFLQTFVHRYLFSRKAKIVCTVKKNTYVHRSGFMANLKERLARLSLRQVDHIIATSRATEQLLKSHFSLPSSKISVCHHLGVDINLFKPDEGKQFVNHVSKPIVIGYCGRFDADKGIEDLVDAVHQVKERIARPIVLSMLGSGTYKDWLRCQQKKFKWLQLMPPVTHSKVAGFLQKLDIFVLPSRILPDHQEHDAHALLEALATGVASVGTNTGIIPEILGDGTGYLVDPERPDKLAMMLVSLINNSKERKALALRGRKKAIEEFAVDVIAQIKIDIFRKVINDAD